MNYSSGSEKTLMVSASEGARDIAELVKVDSIEEANRLLKEEHVFLAVYYNQALSREEYILGRLKEEKSTCRPIGFNKNP